MFQNARRPSGWDDCGEGSRTLPLDTQAARPFLYFSKLNSILLKLLLTEV